MSNWPVFVINLDRSTDRWETINKLFSKEDLIRIPAVDGYQWADGTCHEDGRPKFREGAVEALIEDGILAETAFDWYHWIPAEIGCALSHIKVWKHIVDNNIEWAIILEDDAVPTNALTGTIQETLEDTLGVPHDADVIFLPGENNPWKAVQIDRNNRLKNGFGNTGYVISKVGAEKAIKAQLPMYFPCDMQWWSVAFKDLNLYVDAPNKVEKGYAYAMTEGLVDVDTDNWTTTMTPSGSKPWKKLPYERMNKNG